MKRSKLLLIAGILGIAYFIYIVVYFFGSIVSSETGMDMVTSGLATALVTPHIVCVGIAVAFNWIGWAIKARWGAITAGVLYAVSIVFMFLYAICVLPQAVLCFIGAVRMGKKGDTDN